MNKSIKERFDDNWTPEPYSGCWIWTKSTHTNGYGLMIVKGVLCRANRIAWTLYNGEIPIGFSVLHRCDVRCCVNPNHLFLGTQLDNIKDRVRKGRNALGESHGHSKFTEDDIRKIRSDSRSRKQVAEEYNISQGHLRRILIRELWAHVS